MLYALSLISAVVVLISGIYVIARGTWHKFGLKFAAVALSTTAAAWLLLANYIFDVGVFHPPAGLPPTATMAIQFYFVLRNAAFVIFHIAVGRDAIHLRNGDRRGTSCRMNLQKPLPR